MVKTSYNADSIKSIKGLESIRRFPGVYIGDIGLAGVFHLFREVLDNSLDENKAGFCSRIDIYLNEQTQEITVSDNGRGIPVEKLVDIFMELHTSGKYEGENYKESIGMHGQGNKTVTALSKFLKVNVSRDGKLYEMQCSKAKLVKDVHEIGVSKHTGTTVSFIPDEEILEEIEFDHKQYMSYCREVSFLYPNLKINFNVVMTKDGKSLTKEFCSKEGLVDYIKYLEKAPLFEPIRLEQVEEGKAVEAIVTFRKENREEMISFCNGVKTVDGGTHETGFKQGLTRVMLKYIQENNLLNKKDEKLEITGDDMRLGIVAVIYAKHSSPQFRGQHKGKLISSDISGTAQKLMTTHFANFLNDNKLVGKMLAARVINNAKLRIKAKKVYEVESKRTDTLTSLNKLSKFIGCSSNNPDECELFIVEGKMPICSR